MEIEALKLPAATENALKRAGYLTVESIGELTFEELHRIKRIGAQGAATITNHTFNT